MQLRDNNMSNVKISRLNRIEDHLHQFRLLYTCFPEIEKVERNNYTLLRSHYDERMFNGVLRTYFPNPRHIEDRISEILNFFPKQHPMFWYENSSSVFDDLHAYLKNHRFQFSHTFSCLEIDLNNFCFSEQASKEIKILPVDTEQLVNDFLIPLNRCFPLSTMGSYYRHKIYSTSLKSHSPNLLSFVATFNDIPVGSISLFIHLKEIGAYNLSVLPEFGRQGIAKTLLEVALNKAKQLGYHQCFAQATTQGLALLTEKFGFNSLGLIKCYVRKPT